MRTWMLFVGLTWVAALAPARADAAEGRPPTLEEELAEAKAEVEQLRKALVQSEKEVAELRHRLAACQQDLARAANELERLTSEFRAANEVLGRIREDPRMFVGKVPLPPPEPRRPEKPIQVKVTGVDKRLGLVIINKGQRHGVRKGDLVEVFRDKRRVVRVVVDEVFPDMSACHYDPKAADGAVEIGDDATTPREEIEEPQEGGKPQK